MKILGLNTPKVQVVEGTKMEEVLKSFQFSDLKSFIPESFISIFITFALSFLIGLEREEHSRGKFYKFGGVRTFPLIGLCGYLLARLSDGHPLAIGVGVLVLGALLWLSYRKKLELSSSAGMTSEVSGLFTFLMGALIFKDALWEATTLTVIVLLLLELKSGLESLAQRIPGEEIFTFTRFLLITAVILPIVPNQNFTTLQFNPFHAWVIVVTISGLSYAAYAAGKMLGPHQSILLVAILGGIYSSTSTTVVLAKRSRHEKSGPFISGAIVIASGIMYFRLVVLLSLFNWELGRRLAAPFVFLGFLFVAVGSLWMIHGKKSSALHESIAIRERNPLELGSALVFAVLFSAMAVLTVLAWQYFGTPGIYILSFVTGLTDVDPFVMSLTQSSGVTFSSQVAATAILIATASNNLMKGLYAALWGGQDVKRQASWMLVSLGGVSLLALFFI